MADIIENELNLDQQVTVKSIAGWEVGFARINGFGDVKIPSEGSTRLSRNEIISQVQNGNKLFTGVDGMGSHATLIIKDLPTRKELNFESGDNKKTQKIFSDSEVKRIFDIKTSKSFEESFKETFLTRAEKYAVMKAIKRLGINDYNKIKFAELNTGYSV